MVERAEAEIPTYNGDEAALIAGARATCDLDEAAFAYLPATSAEAGTEDLTRLMVEVWCPERLDEWP